MSKLTSPPRYIYVASSWRNLYQVAVVTALRRLGCEVYDFRNPKPGNTGFSWSAIHPSWQDWTPEQWRTGLCHPVAQAGYALDREGIDRADCCVLILPSGRSAHLEAAFMAGQGKHVFTLALEPVEPELMTLLLGPPDRICCSLIELFDALALPNEV